MTLVKWVPRNTIINDFDSMLDGIFNDGWNRSIISSNNPSVDIIENENEFELTADLPGLDKKDVNLSIQEGVLKLTADQKTKNDSKDAYWLRERYSKTYDRSFTLPNNVVEEKINASFKNGSLKVILPKEEVVKPIVKKIKIS